METTCNKCGLCKYPGNQCLPKGTSSPMIYIVGEAPGPEERDQGIPFVGKAGKYLTDLLNQLGLTEANCRFFNVVRCYPRKSDEDAGFRAPVDEEIDACSNYLVQDILETNPRVIVPVGATASKFFIKDDFYTITSARGKLYEVTLSDKKFAVIPTYHPSYLMRQYGNQSLRNECISDFKQAISIAIGETDISTVIQSNKRDYDDDTDLCLNYDQFDDFCKREIDNVDEISYDIETNAEEPFSKDFKVVGFSLASRKDKGCYVVLDALDYQMPKKDQLLTQSRMRKILTNKCKKLTYNCMYELPGSLNWLNVEIENIFDVFVMVKIMVGDSAKYIGGKGLKAQCQLHLGYKDWSIDLDNYLGYLRDFNSKKSDVFKILLKYYDKAEAADLLRQIQDLLQDKPELVSRETISYGLAPYKLIGKYGGIDAEVLFPLRDFYNKEIDKMNEEMGIDIHKGVDYWIKHHIAGYVLERNGAYWDDKEADAVESWCRGIMHDSLKYIVSSSLTLPWIRNRVIYWEYIKFLRMNKLDQILGGQTIPGKMTKNTMRITTANYNLIDRLTGMSLIPEKETIDGKVYKLEMGHFEALSQVYMNSHREEFDQFVEMWMNKYLSEDHSIDSMRGLFNPTSTSPEFRAEINRILVTEDIKLARIYDQILILMEDPKFSIDQECSSKYNPNIVFEDDKKLLSLIDKIHVMDIPSVKKLTMVSRQLQTNNNYKGWRLKRIIRESLEYQMEKLDDDHIIELYKWYELIGMNIEDESTWSDEFRWLYNYRMFKKASKIISTYIDGRVGRQNVYCADKRSVQNGDLLTKTDGHYKKDSDEAYILHTEFKVNNADTGRWKATMHTMPAGRTVKRIIKSRFPGGVIFCPDCSQAEVRVLARVANDKNLNDAFDDGLDIHRFVASKAFNKPMEEITKAERSYAKGAVFGILYGESQKSFADSFTHGDMVRAEEIFNNIFTAFPGIKTYIEESHDQFRKHKKVSLLTDRFIDMVEFERQNGSDIDRIYRQAQNYRIQGATCDLAGLILYKICEYIKDHNMKSKPFCFIHDSIEIDSHPDETFRMIDILTPLFNQYPRDEFGVHMASDIVLSTNMGAECEVVEHIHDPEYNNIELTLKGSKTDLDELYENWVPVYKSVIYEDIGEPEKEYMPRSGLFQKKVTFSTDLGTTKEKIKRKFTIITK